MLSLCAVHTLPPVLPGSARLSITSGPLCCAPGSRVPSPAQRTLSSARPSLTPTQAGLAQSPSFTPSFLQSAITHRNGFVAFCICFLSSSLTERVCPPPSCLRCPRTVPGTTHRRSSSVFVSKWMCLKCSCVSLVERCVRLALGAQLFLWPPVLCSVIQSWQLADRGEGVSQGTQVPRNIQLTSPTCAPPRAEECRGFLETLLAWPLEGGDDCLAVSDQTQEASQFHA